MKNDLYHKYLNDAEKQNRYELLSLELKEKWPSGPRMKQHEAKRILLGWLIHYQNILDNKDHLSILFENLNTREANQKLVKTIFEII